MNNKDPITTKNNRRLLTQRQKVRLQLKIPVNNSTASKNASVASKRSYPTHWYQPYVPPSNEKCASNQSLKTLGVDVQSRNGTEITQSMQ